MLSFTNYKPTVSRLRCDYVVALTHVIEKRLRFLSAIGKRYFERTLALLLHSEIANRWQDVITQGLFNDDRMESIKKSHLPENCVFSKLLRLETVGLNQNNK
ncbi:hypothetical protein TSAR_016904 [Trichomalopsis sarcophagae]|uniref:Uncharacterized protein n=1 Tax=Trichomalopsis sarcophagae TaxID=543379 RepID=A0A232EP06_9HYME|nr:hypothetical protein TSAR_016904 [Trichomalopsis sarcophagae]